MNDLDEITYKLYSITKRLIEKAESCDNKEHSDDPIFKDWKKAIKLFDSLKRGYAERYEEEKIKCL